MLVCVDTLVCADTHEKRPDPASGPLASNSRKARQRLRCSVLDRRRQPLKRAVETHTHTRTHTHTKDELDVVQQGLKRRAAHRLVLGAKP